MKPKTALIISHFCTYTDVTEVPTVEDINECSDATLNSCSVNANCTNTDGSYTCACNSGTEAMLSLH